MNSGIHRQCLCDNVDIYACPAVHFLGIRSKWLNCDFGTCILLNICVALQEVQLGISQSPIYSFLNLIVCTFSTLRNSFVPILNKLIS